MTEQEKKWQEVARWAETVMDAVGCPLDEGICETVVALNVFGISTLGSCEGHLERGIAAPWVDIGDPEAQLLARQAMRKMQEGARYKGEAELLRMAAKRLHFVVRRYPLLT